MSKERPIIFNTEMVRAILEGRKTVTRRPIKPGFEIHANGILTRRIGNDRLCPIVCPFGQIGDRLYVRETCKVGAWWAGNQSFAMDYKADGFIRKEWLHVPTDDEWNRRFWKIQEQLDSRKIYPDEDDLYRWEKGESPLPWIPSIHMPKWAARIWLEITDIRVERVQDIDNTGALNEGIAGTIGEWFGNIPKCFSKEDGHFYDNRTSRDNFGILWDSMYNNWNENPWVWVVEFKRVEK